MKGLIKKDLYFLGSSLKMIIIAMIVMGVGASFLISSEIFIIIYPIILGSAILTTIPKEKNNKWDKFIAMTPLSRETLLKCKYVLYISMVIIGILIGSCIVFANYLFMKKMDLLNVYTSFALSISVSLLSGSISLPINFLWNEEKAIVGQISSYTCVALFLVAILYGINLFISVKDNIVLIMCSLGIISAFIFAISWFISKNKVVELEYH